jgi:hypothetical protein
MALEPVPRFHGVDPKAFDSDQVIPVDHADEYGARTMSSSHTVGRSAHTSGQAAKDPSSCFSQRPLKRQRLDSPLPRDMHIDPPTSRDAMPPPQKPMSRMQSVRKMIPTLRKKFSHSRRFPLARDTSRGHDDVHMYEDSYHSSVDDESLPVSNKHRSETPYISGALPVEQPSHFSDTQDPQLLASGGIGDGRSEFTFRAPSPVKMNLTRSAQLPTEPSYIRLMDGLANGNGPELGLRDPRDGKTRGDRYSDGSRQVTEPFLEQRHLQEPEPYKRWSLGHPFLHQSPYGSSASVNDQLDHPQYGTTNNNPRRMYNESVPIPVTPAPRRLQHPHQQFENVVSPFFGSSRRQEPARITTNFAEPQDSLRRSGASQLQSSKVKDPRTGWHKPRGLNGLSFFDTPMNSKNEPIQYTSQGHRATRPLSSGLYQTRNFDSQGFITRSAAGRSPFASDSAYGSSRKRPYYDEQMSSQTRSAIPFPTFERQPYSRASHLPSTMPSIISGRTPVRAHPQWELLERAGVRSSRNTYSGIRGNTSGDPWRHRFSSSGQRSVRR